MKSLLLTLFFLFCSVTLWGDAVIVIKGINRRPTIKLAEHSGASCRVKRYNGATEVSCRPRKQFQHTKLTFKVLSDDDFAFTVGGGYIRKEGNKKDEFDWIECSLFKVNGQEMIGSSSVKGGQKGDFIARPRAVKGSVKVKKGGTLTVEFTLRAVSRKEIRKREGDAKMSKHRKDRSKRDEDAEKADTAEQNGKNKKADSAKGAAAKTQKNTAGKGKAESENTAEQKPETLSENTDE